VKALLDQNLLTAVENGGVSRSKMMARSGGRPNRLWKNSLWDRRDAIPGCEAPAKTGGFHP